MIKKLYSIPVNYLVGLWIALNLFDTYVTILILDLGGVELNLIYQATESMIITSIVKYLYVIFILFFLWKVKKIQWLVWFDIGILLVVLWNINIFMGSML